MVLTNAHTHLELTDLAQLCPTEPTSFVRWMGRLVWQLQMRTKAQIQASIAHGIAELQACGTTHVGDITNTWLSVEPLLASGLHGVVYLEVLGHHRQRALQRLEQAKQKIKEVRRRTRKNTLQIGLSLHAPYSCHPDLLRLGADWCRAEKVPLCVHVAESPAETELLLSGRLPDVPWPLTFLAKQLCILPKATPRLRPVPYLAELGVLAAQPLLVHAVQVTAEEIDVIAEAGCAVVHCPRSNERLSCGRMPLERYLAVGVPVYLGTDSRASSPDLNVRAEAEFAQRLHQGKVGTQQVARLVYQMWPSFAG